MREGLLFCLLLTADRCRSGREAVRMGKTGSKNKKKVRVHLYYLLLVNLYTQLFLDMTAAKIAC